MGHIIDYMPLAAPASKSGYEGLIRTVKAVRGTMQFRMECHPAFNYARDNHTTEMVAGGVKFRSRCLQLGLGSQVSLRRLRKGVVAEFTLREGQSTSFHLQNLKSGRAEQTADLKGPTGAIIAAPTCSLPENLGGQRNWDYRYAWIRDAAFTVYSLLRIGFREEAMQFVPFLDTRCHEMEPHGSLLVVYGIDGRNDLPEETLDLEGDKGSHPVRIGNAAVEQLQLDINGELLDSLYLFNKHGAPISYDLWVYPRRIADWVCDNWEQKDHAIWEVRGVARNFVYSKVMCWVAVDRALRLASKRSFPADWRRWMRTRDQIYETVMRRGWNSALDAACLRMPLVFFTDPNRQV